MDSSSLLRFILQEYFFWEIIHIDNQYIKYYDVCIRKLKSRQDNEAKLNLKGYFT